MVYTANIEPGDHQSFPITMRAFAYLRPFDNIVSSYFQEVLPFYATFVVNGCFTAKTLCINIFKRVIASNTHVHTDLPIAWFVLTGNIFGDMVDKSSEQKTLRSME